ncbi:MAG: type IV secretion system DNA-binding domain-containing protein [Patescibacteria group bacterium]
MPVTYNHDHENEITLFGEVNFRNNGRRFGIKTDDRRRHMYLIGKTGMGKTTVMENMILADIYAGHGCCYIDPHGDTAEKLADYIPSHRINDVVYYNPSDTAFPMGFNILELANEEQKPLVASGLMGVFKKIWPDVWSPRMEHILNNCVLALLDYPGSTLLGINRLLVDTEYRQRVIAKIRDPMVKTFWVAEFASWSEKYATEAIAPVQNKVGQFLSSFIIRNIVAQVKSTIDIRRIMDEGKILIVNLSKGRIGEDNMRLLGGMLITKIQLAAQERQNLLEQDRRDFYLYVDEFQNFANESFATILSEARKYRLNLVVAHQYIEQLDEKVIPAIFGNVGTIITMRVGGADAEAMETEFAPTFIPEDLVNLAKYQMYLKLMVDGVSTPPFSANTLPPIAKRTGNAEKIIQVSRERYAEPRADIEQKVLRWSGMEVSMGTETDTIPEEEPVSSAPVLGKPLIKTAFPSGSVAYPAIKTAEERELEDQTTEVVPVRREYLTIKPERMAAIAASMPAPQKKKDKPKFAHTCTRCGKIWHLAIQLDPSRPMYCPECRPIVAEERKNAGKDIRHVKRQPLAPEGRTQHAEMSETSFAGKSQTAVSSNRPRLVREPGEEEPTSIKNASPIIEEPMFLSLADELAPSKGKQQVMREKERLEKRAGEVEKRKPVSVPANPRFQILPPLVPFKAPTTTVSAPATPPPPSSKPLSFDEPEIVTMEDAAKPTGSVVLPPGKKVKF